jgi:hypothetical protein
LLDWFGAAEGSVDRKRHHRRRIGERQGHAAAEGLAIAADQTVEDQLMIYGVDHLHLRDLVLLRASLEHRGVARNQKAGESRGRSAVLGFQRRGQRKADPRLDGAPAP